jgi:tripartite ATP-independent transporter DctM subunit
MAPIMFASLMIFIVIGYPIAFSLAALGLLFGFIGIELGLFAPNFFQALPIRVFDTMSNETLLAIPFFTFMGVILERSRMAEELLDNMGQLFGSIRGGLAYAVIFVGALLAATTGVIAASVIAMGLISLPIMLRYGYDNRVATGVIVSSGALVQIVPPSMVLIVLADQLGLSVGNMYTGALLPAFILILSYVAYI